MIIRRCSKFRIPFAAAVAGLLLAVAIGLGDEQRPDQPNGNPKKTAKKHETRKPINKDAGKGKLPAENPLSRFIDRLLGGRGANKLLNPTAPKTPKPASTDGSRVIQDQIDARAPQDPKLTNLLRKAARQIDDENWKQALEILQFLLDRPEDALIRQPDGRWMSIHSQANEMLGMFPETLRQQYRLQYGGIARQLYRDALETGKHEKLVEVATRFFHTESGQLATNRLGTLHFDRGEFGLASRWFGQLLEARAELTNDAKWRMKAAFAFQQSGDASTGERLLRELASRDGVNEFELGGNPVRPESWLDEFGETTAPAPPSLDDWPLFLGSPARTGSASGGTPLLLPRWSFPTTYSLTVRNQMQALMQALSERQRATIPTFSPLMVDDKVVFRTLRGVQVLSANTGQTLWETQQGISPEHLLNGKTAISIPTFGQPQFRPARIDRFSRQFSRSAAEHHPLTGLLFRNGTYGMLSSDGEQIFVLEEQALLSKRQPGNRWRSRNSHERTTEDWSSNRLTSYDLRNGRTRWEIGGQSLGESFDPPLAGTYFFGAPLPDGDELFVVGEKDNEIRLFAVERESGKPRWSQRIAFSDARIDVDLGRRWWTSQIAASGGVLVCPTTVGWLVAVDRANRSVLWAHRYSKPSPRAETNAPHKSVVSASSLNERWCPSAPVIAGNRVVYTPSEEPIVVCLDLYSGDLVWQRDKGDFLYHAGVFEDRVLLVGKESVSALSLEEGYDVWTQPIPRDAGLPSGIGVATKNRYHLPLSTGQIWSFDIANGESATMSTLPDRRQTLGNLAMYRGTLFSLSPQELSSFEQEEAFKQEIQNRLAKDPHNGWALLRQSALRMLHNDPAAALTSLDQIQSDELSPTDGARFSASMWEALVTLVRSEPDARDTEFQRLADLAHSDEQKMELHRLAAARLIARNQLREAFETYWKLAALDGSQRLVRRDDSAVTVDSDYWLAGRLKDLWADMTAEVRESLDENLVAAANEARGKGRLARERFVTLFDFHPSAARIRQELADAYAVEGNLTRAEYHLRRLGDQSNPQIAAEAIARRIQLLRDFGLRHDASYYYHELEKNGDDTRLANERTIAEFIADLQEADALAASKSQPPAGWGDVTFRIERTGTSHTTTRTPLLPTGHSRSRLRHEYRFTIDAQQRLAVIKTSDESLHWLLPLRAGRMPAPQSGAVARWVDRLLYVLHTDVLYALSPTERRVLWTLPIEPWNRPFGGRREPAQFRVHSMKEGDDILHARSLASQALTGGRLAAANSEYVCVYGRGSLSVFDAATGNLRWRRESIPLQPQVFGTPDVLHLTGRRGSNLQAFRALDGMSVDATKIAEHIAHSITLSKDGLVTVTSRDGDQSDHSPDDAVIVQSFDPISTKSNWRHEFPAKSRLSLMTDERLAVLQPSGKLSLVDLSNGRLNEMGELIPTSLLNARGELFLFSDAETLVLVANQGRHQSSSYTALPSLTVNGKMFAFDRESGQILWEQSIKKQHLVLQPFDHLPLLVFASKRQPQNRRPNYTAMSLLAIDKRTGHRLIDATTPYSSQFRSMTVNPALRRVDFRSYNQRVRLVPADNKSASLTK